MAPDPQEEAGPTATIHEATLASGPSGDVEWGAELTGDEAIVRRKKELDVVVRGNDLAANRRLARQIEEAVGPVSRPQPPHTSTAGKNALPHFHQISRSPDGHTFYETPNRKAKKKKNRKARKKK